MYIYIYIYIHVLYDITKWWSTTDATTVMYIYFTSNDPQPDLLFWYSIQRRRRWPRTKEELYLCENLETLTWQVGNNNNNIISIIIIMLIIYIYIFVYITLYVHICICILIYVHNMCIYILYIYIYIRNINSSPVNSSCQHFDLDELTCPSPGLSQLCFPPL